MKNKYTKKRVDIILNSLASLSSRSKAAEAAGIAYKTYKEWYNEIPEFKNKVDEVLDETRSKLRDDAVKSIADNFKTDYRAACWWLERTYPDEFAKKEKLDQTMTIDAVKIKYILPEPQEEQIPLPLNNEIIKIELPKDEE